jgi:hypothetical protein
MLETNQELLTVTRTSYFNLLELSRQKTVDLNNILELENQLYNQYEYIYDICFKSFEETNLTFPICREVQFEISKGDSDIKPIDIIPSLSIKSRLYNLDSLKRVLTAEFSSSKIVISEVGWTPKTVVLESLLSCDEMASKGITTSSCTLTSSIVSLSNSIICKEVSHFTLKSKDKSKISQTIETKALEHYKTLSFSFTEAIISIQNSE